MKRSIKFLLLNIILIISVCLNINVFAKTVTPDEIEGSAYVIGTHMFNREVNEKTGYEGRLTTNLIMFASKTIESNDLSSMIIYYKTASGKWINGLTGGNVTLPESFEINYTNLQLEDVNNTVRKPKNPIIYFDGPLSINEENIFSYSLRIYIDDMDDITNKVDGVEVMIVNKDGYIEDYDLKYGEKFNMIFTPTEDSKEDLVVGKRYHYDFLTIENNNNSIVRATVKAYVLDGNGEKIYSDSVYANIDWNTNFPAPVIVNEYYNPEYVSKSDGNYYYRLGIEYPEPYVYKINPNKFAYALYEKNEASSKYIGVFGLTEKADIVVPENNVKSYYAILGYYDADNKFNHSLREVEEFIIDTRTLTAPVLKGSTDLDNGEYLEINDEFYEEQDEKSLDSLVEKAEFYEIYYQSGVKKYRLVKDGFTFALLFPNNGAANYVARVYATNAAGKKVYSDFSNEITVVRTPKIEISECINGKVKVSVVNKDEFSSTIGYEIYDYNGNVLLGETNSINDIIELQIDSDKRIYAKAKYFVSDTEIYYSGKSASVIADFQQNIMYGELTGDGVVDIGDAIKIWRYTQDVETLTEQEMISADVNGDGYVDFVDAILIQCFDSYPNIYKNTLPEKQITDYILYGDTLDVGYVTTDSPEYFAAIERHLNGTNLLEGQALKNADINGDGKVDGVDKALMFGYINEEVEFDLPSPTPITDYVLYGDIDEDGELTEADRNQLSQFLRNEITISQQAFKNADVNGDGSINDDDYNLLNAYINLHSDSEIIYPLYKDELKYYKITYELFDGKATNVSEYSIASGDIILKNPTKKGYTFIGWTGSNGDIPQKDLVIENGTTGNLHYEANYEAKTYTIKYHANSETAVGTMADATFVYSNADDLYYTVLESSFTNEGYKFDGWALKPNATTDIMGPPIRLYKTEVADYANEDNVVNLYAIWREQ